MTIETISQPLERIEKSDIEFHPLVKLELRAELQKWLSYLEQAPPQNVERAQGRISILRWVLEKMPDEILAKEREKAKGAEASE